MLIHGKEDGVLPSDGCVTHLWIICVDWKNETVEIGRASKTHNLVCELAIVGLFCMAIEHIIVGLFLVAIENGPSVA